MSTLYAPAEHIWTRNVLPRVERVPGPLAEPCWRFRGAVNSRGYGCVSAGRGGRTVLVHRLAVAVRDGAMPTDVVDHLCFVRLCCNPAHLEEVTTAENNRRSRYARGYRVGGRCGRGHELSGANVRQSPRNAGLICRTCCREDVADREARAQVVAGRVPARVIREWALSVGIPVPRAGRLSIALRDAYLSTQEASAA